MPILDTHLHLIYPDKFSHPWLEGAPAINRPFSAETYFAEASALGIVAALHMEADVAEKAALRHRNAERIFRIEGDNK